VSQATSPASTTRCLINSGILFVYNFCCCRLPMLNRPCFDKINYLILLAKFTRGSDFCSPLGRRLFRPISSKPSGEIRYFWHTWCFNFVNASGLSPGNSRNVFRPSWSILIRLYSLSKLFSWMYSVSESSPFMYELKCTLSAFGWFGLWIEKKKEGHWFISGSFPKFSI
jgi:hypothetical protein